MISANVIEQYRVYIDLKFVPLIYLHLFIVSSS